MQEEKGAEGRDGEIKGEEEPAGRLDGGRTWRSWRERRKGREEGFLGDENN